MELLEILNKIEVTPGCKLINREHPISVTNNNLPEDLEYYFKHYDGIQLFEDQPYGIEIVGLNDFRVTNEVLFPEDDVIWEELEGDQSENWYMIAKAEELEQFISIDLDEDRKVYCYDSFLETHANPGSSLIIAKSFTERLKNCWKAKVKTGFG